MEKPISICCDGNFLFHSEYSIFSDYGKKKDGPFLTSRDEVSFLNNVANKFFHFLSNLPYDGRLVFVMDSRSWRKGVFIEDGGYKSSREREDGSKGTMSRETKETFYRLMDEFASVLKSKGVTVSRIEGAEGDDLLYYWSRRLNKEGHNCVLITGDGDIGQCVSGSDAPWTIVWNGSLVKGRIYSAPGWLDHLNKPSENDVFSFSLIDKNQLLRELINDHPVHVEYVDTDTFVFKKILVGDNGDDVPSVWTKTKNNRTYGITEKKASEIMGNMPAESKWMDSFSEDYILSLSGVILRMMKDVDGTAERAVVAKKIFRNRRLLWLNEAVFPEKLVERMDQHVTSQLQMPTQGMLSKKEFFAGTRFEAPVAPRKFDPFGYLTLPGEW